MGLKFLVAEGEKLRAVTQLASRLYFSQRIWGVAVRELCINELYDATGCYESSYHSGLSTAGLILHEVAHAVVSPQRRV